MRSAFCVMAVLAAALSVVAIADDQSAARAVIDASIEAQGGEAVCKQIVATYYDGKGFGYQGDAKTPIHNQWYFQKDEEMRWLSLNQDGKIEELEVVHGKDGWVKDGDQATEEMSKDQLKSHQDLLYANWEMMLVPLKSQEFRLSLLDEINVNGRKAVGVLVSHDGHDPLKLYFDKENHLLVKYERKYKNVDEGKVIVEETTLWDYRDVQKTKQPFKFEVFWDGAKVEDLSASAIKLYEQPLDEKLFSKP